MPHIHELDWKKHTKIALDVDETLAESINPGLADFHKMGKMLAYKDKSQITSFDWIELPESDITYEEFITYWRMHSLKGIQPMPGSIDTLYTFGELGYQLHVVTARNEKDHRTDTVRWIAQYYPEIHPTCIYFTNHLAKNSTPKSLICKSLNISLLIDDGLHNAIDVAGRGIDCILLDKPWNQGEVDPSLPIYRVNDWNEIKASLKHHHR